MGKADYKKIGKCWNTDYLPTATRDELFDYMSDDSPSMGKKVSKRATPKKTNHKHIFVKVLVKSFSRNPLFKKEEEHYGLADMCEVCGIIKNSNYYVYDKDEKGHCRFLTTKEILKKYKDLQIIDLTDCGDEDE